MNLFRNEKTRLSVIKFLVCIAPFFAGSSASFFDFGEPDIPACLKTKVNQV